MSGKRRPAPRRAEVAFSIAATQLQMLRRFGDQPRHIRYFTSTGMDVILSTANVQRHLESLEETGYVRRAKELWLITAAGRHYLSSQAEQATPIRLTNATSPATYKPTELLRSNRPGANDALDIPSFGTLC
jgi:hypothetical protein